MQQPTCFTFYYLGCRRNFVILMIGYINSSTLKPKPLRPYFCYAQTPTISNQPPQQLPQ